jgi:hypothetical protein
MILGSDNSARDSVSGVRDAAGVYMASLVGFRPVL